jgi:uncharacterized protein (TIGR03437 family)
MTAMVRPVLIVLGAQMLVGQVTGVWEQRAPYPLEATEVSGAAIDGFVYVVCGLTAAGSTNRLFRYDPRVDSWRELARLPVEGGADHCNVAAAGGKLYVLGSIRVGSPFVDGTTWQYDPAQDRWESVARMGTPRGASGVAAIGRSIYVAGGLTAGGSVSDFEAFDTETRQWTRSPNMPTARDHLTAQAINGRVYAIGGRAARDLNANEEYEPTTSTWRSRAPIPTARGGLGSAAVDDRIKVFGGEGNSGSPEGTFSVNEEYDPARNTWRNLARMPTPRHGLYGIAIGRGIFVPGGGPRAGAFYTSAHEAFFLPPAQGPQIADGGIVSAAGGHPAITRGSLVSLYGTSLAPAEQAATPSHLPKQMSAVSVRVNGNPVPLLFVSPQQINFLLPFETQAPPSIIVNYAGSESRPAPLRPENFRADSAPAIFTISAEAQAAALIAGTGLVAGPARNMVSRPAHPGEVIEIYCAGLGAVSNPPPEGMPASDVLSKTVGTTIVMVGTTRPEVLFSGLAPGLAGVYQVNARIPEDAPFGDRVPLSIQVNESGLTSNRATIAVQ